MRKNPNKPSKAWKRAPAFKKPTSLPSARPAAPLAPQAPVDKAPWEQDASYQDQLTTFGEERQLRDQNLVSRRDRSLADAGYTMNFSTGALSPVAVADNPYSRAAAMKSAYDQSVKGATNSFAARGQYYSGALDRQRVSDANRYTAQVSDLLDRLRTMNEDVQSGLESSRVSYDASKRRAQQEAINRALEASYTEQGEAGPQMQSPRFYQKQINQLLRTMPKGKKRGNKIRELIKLRNEAERQLNGAR